MSHAVTMPHEAFRASPLLLAVLTLSLIALSPLASARATEPSPGGGAVVEAPVESHAPGCTCEEHAAPAPRPRNKRTFKGDVSRGWVHVGGGFGATVADVDKRYSVRSGRFTVGGGKYVPFFYGGGGLEITGSEFDPIKLRGVGYAGFAPPIPVFHPMVGIRVGGGHHLTVDGMKPHVLIGPQAGFILRRFDARAPGIRVMLDAGVEWRFVERRPASELMLTFAAVF